MEKYMLKKTDKVAKGYICTRVFAEMDAANLIADGYTEVSREEALEKAGQENMTSKYLGVTLTVEKQRINIDIDRELWRRVSIKAAAEDREKREIVETALSIYLDEGSSADETGRPSYCERPNFEGTCRECSLTNYNRDCRNNPVREAE